MTGTYQRNGDYCTFSGKACFITGLVDVYYSLPIAATAQSGSIVHCGNDNYEISTGSLDNISILHMHSFYGNQQPSGTIEFTITYKYR